MNKESKDNEVIFLGHRFVKGEQGAYFPDEEFVIENPVGTMLSSIGKKKKIVCAKIDGQYFVKALIVEYSGINYYEDIIESEYPDNLYTFSGDYNTNISPMESFIQLGYLAGLAEMKQNTKTDITFGTIRNYIAVTAHVSICRKETGDYNNYESIEQVPHDYDNLYLYGIGITGCEFYEPEKHGSLPAAYDYKTCLEIVLWEG